MRIMIDALHESSPITASDLRAALARNRGRAYCVAALLRIHPTTLSLILNGHRAFDQALAQRILEALKLEQRHRQNNAASRGANSERGMTEERTDDDRNLT